MEGFENALSRMFPSMAPVPVPSQSNPSILGDGTATPVGTPAPKPETSHVDKVLDEARAQGESIAGASDELLAEKLYPSGGDAGAPLGDYDHMLGQMYDPLETHHRGIKDDEGVRLVQEGRAATNAALKEYAVGQSEAGRLMTTLNDFYANPRDAESIERLSEVTFSTLRAELGTRADAYVAGAKRVADELSRKVPGFREILESGAGSDIGVIKVLANAARRKGYIK